VSKGKKYKSLVKIIGMCPDRELGKWLVETMESLKKLNGMDSSIHFAELLVSGEGKGKEKLLSGMGMALSYIDHILDQEGDDDLHNS